MPNPTETTSVGMGFEIYGALSPDTQGSNTGVNDENETTNEAALDDNVDGDVQFANAVDSVPFFRIIEKPKNTYDTFKKLTGGRQWVPFKKNRLENTTSKEEHALFVDLEKKYDTKKHGDNPESYNAFEVE